jgi:hypothetical protein
MRKAAAGSFAALALADSRMKLSAACPEGLL